MNLGKSLKGLFVPPDDEEPEKGMDEISVHKTAAVHTSPMTRLNSGPVDVTQGKIDDGINLPGNTIIY